MHHVRVHPLLPESTTTLMSMPTMHLLAPAPMSLSTFSVLASPTFETPFRAAKFETMARRLSTSNSSSIVDGRFPVDFEELEFETIANVRGKVKPQRGAQRISSK